ncbi:MAG: preprotein translocase subunit SecG [Angelakisella sp.]|nr:preprotein translocase subunit SecG [Angelakisella sp.]
MGTFEIICAIVLILISVAVVVLVALQDPKGDGLSALAGGNSFLSNNSDRSMDATLNRLVKGLVIVFLILTVVIYVVSAL